MKEKRARQRIKRAGVLRLDKEYYATRLQDAELLERAVPVIVRGTAYGLAVPAGGCRKMGSIELFGIRDADIPVAMSLLRGKRGFQNVKYKRFPSNRKVKPDYYWIRWGNARSVSAKWLSISEAWNGDGKSPDARIAFMKRQGRLYGYRESVIEDVIRLEE